MSAMKELFMLLQEVEERKRNSGECNECCKEDEGIKGYHTIIPNAVFDKTVALMEAHNDLRKTLVESSSEISNTLTGLPKEEKDYAVFEFMGFNDMLRESWDKITDLVAIHEVFTKEDIDSLVRDTGLSLDYLVKMRMIKDVVDMFHR